MKSPREILLERHREAGPKLDAVRKEVLSGLNNEETKEQSWLTHLPGNIWRELIGPYRKAWAGFVVVWVAIIFANIAIRQSAAPMAKNSSSEVAADFKQQQYLLAELIGTDDRHIAEPPKKSTPQPRSESVNRFLKT